MFFLVCGRFIRVMRHWGLVGRSVDAVAAGDIAQCSFVAGGGPGRDATDGTEEREREWDAEEEEESVSQCGQSELSFRHWDARDARDARNARNAGGYSGLPHSGWECGHSVRYPSWYPVVPSWHVSFMSFLHCAFLGFVLVHCDILWLETRLIVGRSCGVP
jgi:hypothetical protein